MMPEILSIFALMRPATINSANCSVDERAGILIRGHSTHSDQCRSVNMRSSEWTASCVCGIGLTGFTIYWPGCWAGTCSCTAINAMQLHNYSDMPAHAFPSLPEHSRHAVQLASILASLSLSLSSHARPHLMVNEVRGHIKGCPHAGQGHTLVALKELQGPGAEQAFGYNLQKP